MISKITPKTITIGLCVILLLFATMYLVVANSSSSLQIRDKDCPSWVNQSECDLVVTVYFHTKPEAEGFLPHKEALNQIKPVIKSHAGKVKKSDRRERTVAAKFKTKQAATDFIKMASDLPFVYVAWYEPDHWPAQ